MTGAAEVVTEVLSSSVVATLDGEVVNVMGVCSVCERVRKPWLRAAATAFFLCFLCCLIVCLCLLVMIEGATVMVVKSLHSL